MYCLVKTNISFVVTDLNTIMNPAGVDMTCTCSFVQRRVKTLIQESTVSMYTAFLMDR